MSGVVLLTGGGGFIGRHVRKRLVAEGFVVSRADDGPVDCVVNLAAPTGLPETRANPAGTVIDAVQSTIDVLEVARRWPVRRFVHAATEEQYRTPVQPYGAAKTAQQAAVEAYRDTYGIPTTILNADLVFGPGQPKSKVIPQMAAALREGRPADLVVDARGHGIVRRFSYVHDYADCVVRALTDPEVPAEIDVPGWVLPTTSLLCVIAEATGLLIGETERRVVETDGRELRYAPLPPRLLRAALLESL